MSNVSTARAPLYRFAFILRELAARPQSAFALAEKLEVSDKTVRRDLDYMRDMLNVPIEVFGPGKGRGYKLAGAGVPCERGKGRTALRTVR